MEEGREGGRKARRQETMDICSVRGSLKRHCKVLDSLGQFTAAL